MTKSVGKYSTDKCSQRGIVLEESINWRPRWNILDTGERNFGALRNLKVSKELVFRRIG